MDIDNNTDAIALIRAEEQRKIDSGEVVKTARATFNFSYMSDEKYKGSKVDGLPESLGLNRKIIETTEKTIDSLGLGDPIIITVRLLREDDSVELIPSLGIGGQRISENEVDLVFDPLNPKIEEGLDKWFVSLAPHEINHLARSRTNKRGHSLLDALISEGLAVYQERDNVFQPEISPWGVGLNALQEYDEWARAQTELDSNDFDKAEWFFGKGGTHPVWTGYSLGLSIVKKYFENNPSASMSEAIVLPSEQILKASGYGVT